MESLPWYVAVTFGITALLTIVLFSKASHYSKPFLALLLLLAGMQSALGLTGFYNNPQTMTGRFPLLVLPLTAICASLFFSQGGRAFIDSLNIKLLTILHTIRILVEIVLFLLFVHHAIPQAMTFEGKNFDILSGISAPLVYYFGFIKPRLGWKIMIAWNVVCMLLLLHVVSSAALSLPARYENLGFEQPNIAVGYFPFLLLPAILVPLVLFANAAAIRQLIINKNLTL